MSRRAWGYIWLVFLMGVLLGTASFAALPQQPLPWSTFVVLTALATFAQLFSAHAPKHQSYHIALVFLFAGALLLHPFLFILLVAIQHLTEWVVERLTKGPRLRNWYLQPFNIATHIIAGLTACWIASALGGMNLPLVLTATVAAISYLCLNHALIGLALILARGFSWRESQVLAFDNLLIDLVLLCLGYTITVLWSIDPWLILPALMPLVVMYRALAIPQLKEEAQTDSKTGLWNARHFSRLFQAELERAKRFERPLAVIMADLDLLRNINNTYGHLAGDTVLAGIGQILRKTIREYDIAGRFGGEEFAIVLPESGPIEAHTLAERIRRAIEAASFEVSTSPAPIQVTMSLGVACFPDDAGTATDLTHEADVAVYQAKLKGRNRVVCAADVPHDIKLESATTVDRLATPYNAAFMPRQVHPDSGT